MIGGMLKHIVLAFFLMVAISQISPLAGKKTGNRCKIRNFWVRKNPGRKLLGIGVKKKGLCRDLAIIFN